MRLTRHYVIAGWTLDTGPSGAVRRSTSILRAMPALLEPGERITLLHGPGRRPDDLPPEIRLDAIQVPSAPAWRRVLAERRHVAAKLDSIGADLLELGTLPIPPRVRCPIVLTVHDLRDLETTTPRHPRWLARRALRSSVARAQTLVTPSTFTSNALRTHLGNLLPPIEIIPGGVDDDLLAIEPRAPRGRPYFLHVGHLEPRKNLLMLVSAYATFLEDARTPLDELPALVLVGRDAGARDAIHERALMLDLTAHVHFEASVPDDHLRALYAGATAVMIPSRYEGFGLPAIEALAVGVPTVVADAGALPEVVGSFGQVLPADDVQAWARAMSGWAIEPRNEAAIDARKAFAARNHWSRIAEATLDTWRRTSGV